MVRQGERKIIPLGFKYGSGKGWRYVWHPDDPKDRYHFETLECLYRHIFEQYGVLERFGPMFCRSDIINNYYPQIPQTLKSRLSETH